MNLKESFKTFFSNAEAQAKTIADLEAKLSSVQLSFENAVSEQEATKAELAKTLESLSTANTSIDGLKTQLKEYELAVQQAQELEKSAAVQAVKHVASVGISPLPLNKVETAKSSSDDVTEQYSRISDPIARSAFFKANKDRILNNK